MQLKQNLYALALVALLGLASLSTSQAAPAGIKGQAQEKLPGQQAQAIKGPRQQAQAIKAPIAAPAPVRLVPVAPQPIKSQQQLPLGPGNVSPIFNSKRPLQPAPAPAPVAAAPLPASVIIQQQQQQAPEPEITQQQQQQIEQASEIDPTGAAQDSAPAFLAPATSAGIAAPASEEEANPKPEPYAFNYAFEAGDSVSSGSSTREEQQDASGRVTGFYTLKGQDGRDRRVDYVADAAGFRATISTNEMGTAQKEPADVRLSAQGPTDAQLRVAESATELARQRALLAPQQQQLQQQQERLPAASNAAPSKLSPSRAQQAAASKLSPSQQRQESESAEQAAIVQLQEPFEQIRQTELNSRARKSRHAPFYLYTI